MVKKKIDEEPKFCCDVCPVRGQSKSFHIPPEGPDKAEILILGEAPGADEDEYRMPNYPNGRNFIGRSGQVLRNALIKLGIQNDVRIDNTVKCRPPGNATPNKKLIDLCYPFTEELIKSMPNLKLIVAVGNVPLLAVLKQKGGIKEASGKLFDYPPNPNIKVMPLIHPAAVLYEPKNLRVFLSSMAKIPAALNGDLSMTKKNGRYFIVKTIENWRQLKEVILKQPILSFDLETTSLNPFEDGAMVKCVGFSFKFGTGVCIPLGIGCGWTFDEYEEIHNGIEEIMVNPDIKKIAQNAKFDMMWLRIIMGIETKGLWRDVGVTEYTINTKEWPNLKDMAWDYTEDMGGYETILGDTPVQDAEGEKLYTYNCMDNDATIRIQEEQEKILDAQPKAKYVIDNLMIPFTMALHNVECNGIRVDPTVINEASVELDKKITDLNYELMTSHEVQRLQKELGVEFNPNSDAQVRKILFEYMGLTPIIFTEKTKQPSVSKDALEGFIKKERIVQLLVDSASFGKMRNTFIKNLMDSICPDLRIHTNFNIVSTITTRTSSDNPNLQNIPTKENDFMGIRKAFVADRGHILAEFDFNQHELRVMADEAHDEVLMADIISGDVHTSTTAAVLNIKLEDVTAQLRRDVGKVINFGLIYGMTEYGVANHLDIDIDTARKYLERYFNRYKGVARWREQTERSIRKNGYVDIRSGFRRHFPIISDLDDKAVRQIIRTALNVPIQGLAGNILGYAFIGVNTFLEGKKSFILLEVHDSILVSIHESEQALIPKIKEIMLTYSQPHIPDFAMPLDVDVKTGMNWGEMEEMK
jgi:DNA polymerase-1